MKCENPCMSRVFSGSCLPPITGSWCCSSSSAWEGCHSSKISHQIIVIFSSVSHGWFNIKNYSQEPLNIQLQHPFSQLVDFLSPPKFFSPPKQLFETPRASLILSIMSLDSTSVSHGICEEWYKGRTITVSILSARFQTFWDPRDEIFQHFPANKGKMDVFSEFYVFVCAFSFSTDASFSCCCAIFCTN